MIRDGLKNTSVTAVLIGAETSQREYVTFEITESYNKTPGNGLLGIYIHRIKDSSGYTDSKGANPFDSVHITRDGQTTYFSSLYSTYDWVGDDGYANLGTWVEDAAAAGR